MRKSSTRLFNSLALTIILSLLLSPFSSLVVAPTTVKALGEIEIDTCEELQLIGNEIAYPLDEDYILTQDIDCSLTNPATLGFDVEGTWGDQTGFNPIGSQGDPFTGTFNGQGFAIDALFINKPANIIGLFAAIDTTSTVSNLDLTNVDIVGLNNVGGLTGINNQGVVNSVTVSGSVEGQTDVGGLIGAMSGDNAEVTNSNVDVEVLGAQEIGGLVGFMSTGLVSNVYSLGTVTATNASVGGLVGVMSGGSIV